MSKTYYRDILAVFVPCVGAIAMLSNLVPNILNGIVGLVLLGGIVISVVLILIGDLRTGRNPARSLLGLALIGLVTFLGVSAPLWYLSSMAHSGSLFDMSSFKNISR